MPPASHGRPLVVEICWEENGVPRQESFGPFGARDDDSHMADIERFLRSWHKLVPFPAARVVLSAVQDPDDWLSAYGERLAAVPPGEDGG